MSLAETLTRAVKTATLSDCRTYRYELTRKWGPEATMVFVMLNPSTALLNHRIQKAPD